jgi:hypothetical protein
MKLSLSLLLLVVWLQPASANTGKIDRYALPPSKIYIEACQREALRLHSGMIDKLRILPRKSTFWIHYEIQMRGGAEWSVICDLSDGSIIRDQSLDGEVSN